MPSAEAEKVAFSPAVTVWLEGSAVILGATLAALTVSRALLLLAEPATLVATAR